jgi:hypothetical protein
MAMTPVRYVANDARIDAMLQRGVSAFRAAFPGRIRAFYLIGSWMDGSAAATSDVDVCVVFKGDFLSAAEEAFAQAVWRTVSASSPVQFDLPAFSERRLLSVGHHRIKTASVLLAGDDIRDQMPAMARDGYLRTYWNAPYAYMARVLRGTDVLRFPVTFPDAGDPFFGYVRTDTSLAPPHATTKALVATVCWIATLLVGFRTGHMVGTKAESVRAYREAIGDPWAPFVERVYTLGKQQWGYRVPERAADRALLRGLCTRMPTFENHYLVVYRSWLLDQLQCPDVETERFVAARLGETLFPDADVREALASLAARADADSREAATRALKRLADVEDAPGAA